MAPPRASVRPDRPNPTRRSLVAAIAAEPLAGPLARAQGAATPADLAGDIAILRDALALHPGLYRYNRPAEIDARLTRLSRAFAASTSSEARYLLLARFTATIRCGHSYANFFNQSDAVAAQLFDRPTRLPFHFAWIDRRMVVLRDAAGLGMPVGSIVTRLNGADPARMLDRLVPLTRADGHNDAKRVSLLEVRGDEPIETFDVLHGLAFGAPAEGVHRLDVRLPDGGERRIEAPAIGLAARRATMRTRDYRGADPVWDWAMRPDGIAVLTMPGWALYNSRWDWRGWLDARLGSLGGARGLIIDLRENEGGEDIGDRILARLIDRPLTLSGAERRVRFRTTPAALNPYLDTWDRSFRTLGEGAEPVGGGFYRLTGERGDDSIQPAGSRLTLPVAALIGPVNSSATFQFAAKARASGAVRLFGSTTGGNRRGINGGAFFFVRLPASGLEVDLPLIGYFPPGAPPDAGIVPDVSVRASAADIAAGRDPVLAAATNWIARG